MEKYNVVEEMRGGIGVVVLTDISAMAAAEIVPGIGANLIRYTLQGQEIIAGPPSLEELRQRSSQFGSAILCPPNRVKGGAFTYGGRRYELPLNDGENHIHGELRVKPWRLSGSQCSAENGASASFTLSLAEQADIFGYYPHRLVFTLTYRLRNGILELEGEVDNEGDSDAPIGIGFHPY